jgi:hypothetical protein
MSAAAAELTVTAADPAAINNPHAAFIPTLCMGVRMGVLDPVAIIDCADRTKARRPN